MLRRTFLKLVGITMVAPNLPLSKNRDWDSLLLSEYCPWKPPIYYVGQILTNKVTGMKLVCVNVAEDSSYWRYL